VDFPHLMLRAKAIQFKKGETSLSHKILTSPQKVGVIASKPGVASIVNWSNQKKFTRKITQKLLGVHPEALVPQYHSKTLSKRFQEQERVADSQYKVAIFGTCYGEYNDPTSVLDLVDILRHNNVDVQLIKKTQCCGMPKMELGDIDSVVSYAEDNIERLMNLVNQGYSLIAPIPSCVLMFKIELPMILDKDPDIEKISKAFYDPFEYLSFLKEQGKLNVDFQPIDKEVLYQMACHQRVQNIGSHTKKILSLIPELDINIASRCSGHDGTYGVRNETHTYAVEIAKPILRSVKESTDIVISNCVMAGNHIAHISDQDLESVHPISLVKLAYAI